MKKTLNVSIGRIAFVIDEDAYHILAEYIDSIRLHCEEATRNEIVEDVEVRIADIFREQLLTPNQVVSVEMVKKMMAIIGNAETFGEYQASQKSQKVKLTRSRKERVIGGVCGGVSEYFGIDITLLRIIAFLLIFFGSLGFWVYIILWIIIPEEQNKFNTNY